jgi:hypothetical protein
MHMTITRLEALKQSLTAARDTDHPSRKYLTGTTLEMHEQHLRGLAAGLQIAISAIDREIRWERAEESLTTGSAA